MGKIPIHKKFKIHDLKLCKVCDQGSCCRHGVELDLQEVADILKRHLDIPKPWFAYLGRSKDFPSGFRFTTLLKNKKCIFQDDIKRCRIYPIRPRFCVEFPLEDGKRAPYYHALCHRAKKSRRQKSVNRSQKKRKTKKS